MSAGASAAFDVEQVLASMTLAEKVALFGGRDFWHLSGCERLGVPSLMVTDGPHGVRKQDPRTSHLPLSENLPATCFPTASALAATWDPALVEEVGVALGEEARAARVAVLLGPGANIKRTPVCGRNFEYFSEDPLLSSRMAAGWIRGVQRLGIGASLKHFAANNQEHRRYSIDARVDERALREIYLASFEGAVREARPWTVMTAYNLLNGVYCAEHPWLLRRVLREEWGFEGVVVSDWGATDDRVEGLRAGCDLEMPGYGGHNDALLVKAVEAGQLPAEAVDTAARRTLTLIARTAHVMTGEATFDREAHHALARRVAAAGTVLLKNDGGLLPLDARAGQRVAVLGAFAQTPRFQGAGSSVMTPLQLDDAHAALTKLLGTERVTYAQGYPRYSDLSDAKLLAEAKTVAAAADVVLVFAGLTETSETEGLDRAHLRLPASHDALIRAATEVNRRVVVVLSNGAPVELPWRDDVPAILEGYLGGEAGGSAIVDVLFGASEPGGRLAETFPLRWEDNPVSAMAVGPRTVEYRESVYVGYRYYDSADIDVLYPFGHGLSYTTFEYSDLRTSGADQEPVQVSVTVTNTGPRGGSEVVQLYVHDVESRVFRPRQELKAFEKVRLAPGESRAVTLNLDRRAFAFWEVAGQRWTVEPGAFELRVGRSSRDVRATKVIQVGAALAEASSATGAEGGGRRILSPAGADGAAGERTGTPSAASFAGETGVTPSAATFPGAPPSSAPTPDLDAAYRDPRRGFDHDLFAALYGAPLPENRIAPRGAFTHNTPLIDMRASRVARLLHWGIHREARAILKDDHGVATLLIRSMIDEMSPRLLLMVSRGVVRPAAIRALVKLANGEWARGAAALVKAILTPRHRRRS